MSAETKARRASVGRLREPLLDFWRGLALIDMAWVHLAAYPIGMPAPLAAWLGEYTRFAAGAFVLLSGMTVARVFGPALRTGGDAAAKVRGHLFRRALMLAVLGRVVSAAFATAEQLRVVSPGTAPVGHHVWSIATLVEPGVTGGLLLLYAFLLLLTPLLAALDRDKGRLATLFVSFAVYALAQAAGDVAHWPPWTFPLAHWQPFFVVGYVLSPYVDHLRTARALPLRVSLASVTLVTAAVFFIRNGPALGVGSVLLSAETFTKVPLQPAEMLWYFSASAFALSWSGWAYVRSETVRTASHWICRLGRWSLLIYVAHLLLELPVVDFLTVADPSPWGRAAMLLVVTALMSAVALAAERLDNDRPTTGFVSLAMLRRALPVAGRVGTGLAAVCLGCVVLLARFGTAPSTSAHYAVSEGDVVVDPGAEAMGGEAGDVGVREVSSDDDSAHALAGGPEVKPVVGADELDPAPRDLDITAEDAPTVQ